MVRVAPVTLPTLPVPVEFHSPIVNADGDFGRVFRLVIVISILVWVRFNPDPRDFLKGQVMMSQLLTLINALEGGWTLIVALLFRDTLGDNVKVLVLDNC